jgi:glycopeptide antibiotics resistance protein
MGLVYVLFFWRGRLGNQFGLKVFDKEHLEMINLVPFYSINSFIKRGWTGIINRDIAVINLLAPLFMYFPMGIFLPVLFAKKYNTLWKVLAFVTVWSVLAEILQFVSFAGSADIDDLILNLVGTVIGYGVVKFVGLKKLIKFSE